MFATVICYVLTQTNDPLSELPHKTCRRMTAMSKLAFITSLDTDLSSNSWNRHQTNDVGRHRCCKAGPIGTRPTATARIPATNRTQFIVQCTVFVPEGDHASLLYARLLAIVSRSLLALRRRPSRPPTTWHSGRTPVFRRRTFPVLRSICSWRVTTYVGKPSVTSQPTRPTQPFILSGSINE